MNSFVPDEVFIKPDISCPGSEIQARFRLRLPRPSDWAANFRLWYKQKNKHFEHLWILLFDSTAFKVFAFYSSLRQKWDIEEERSREELQTVSEE